MCNGRVRRLALAIAAAAAASCTVARPALSTLVEARRVASEMHVEFAVASDAANRAVMADTDEASASAAAEARHAREIVQRDIGALRPLLQSLGYADDIRALDAFDKRFAQYRKLDDEILPLAVENTNLKAQRLSFGPSQEAAAAFRSSLDAALRVSPQRDVCRFQNLAATAWTAVLEIEVAQAPHIAEREDPVMTRIERQMETSAERARKALDEWQRAAPPAHAEIAGTRGVLERFMKINGDIVALSRRNSNVRSLALSLGDKRKATAECEDQLRALDEALARHEYAATR